MSHRDNTRCSHPSGLRKSVPDAICHSGNSICLKNRGQGACSRTKDSLCVLSTRASGGPGLEPGVRVQVTATAWSQLRPRHELQCGFPEHFQPWAVDC